MSDGSPLNVLVICSRPLIDSGGRPLALLDVAEERRRIEMAVKRAGNVAQIHFLPEATTGNVQAVLRDDWNVVHFTGHGTRDGGLLLEDGLGVAHLLRGSEIAQLLSGQERTLVVLSACYSERVGLELHAAGLPAVVAVDARVPIADLAAIIFAEHFYSGLARGWDVQRAFDDAKRAVALDPKVGDSNVPQDAQGKIEEPWSRRFKLIGATASVVASAHVHAHFDTGLPTSVNTNLPPRSANFVGRAKEIVDVIKALDEAGSQRVCVYGSGGLGKTELAKAVARWYIERARVAAVLWASGSPLEGEYKLRDLASLLGIATRVFRLPTTEQSMFDEQKTVVRDFLAAHRAFVLLDNWETIEPQHRGELWNFILSLPDTVRVLVTSRDVLPPRDARNIELDALAPKDAAELFIRTARNAGYFERDPRLRVEEMAILHSLCERLNGYPLAIEVVAGQTLSRTLNEIWTEVQSVPQNVLEGKNALTGESRGVWTSLGLSYDVLSSEEKRLFERMCVFLSPASVEDIAAITEITNPRPVIDRLVKRSLMRTREGAYSLMPIVRDYAETKLADTGQGQRELHARAFTHYGRKDTAEGALASTDHLFELASRFEVRKAGEEFIRYVEGFYQALVTRGFWAEARRKAEQMSVVARTLNIKQKEAQAISELATGFLRIGEYERAAQLTRKAQSLHEESRDKRGVASELHQLGLLAQLQGDYAEAMLLYRRALDISQKLGNKIDEATTLYELGKLARLQGEHDEATRLFRESLEIRKAMGDRGGIAHVLNELGMLALHESSFLEATRLYRESLEIKKEIGDKCGISNTLHELGTLAAAQADYSEAARLYRQGLEIGKELGDRRLISRALNQLGLLALDQGNYDEGKRSLEQSLEIKVELGDKEGIANTLNAMAKLAEILGDYNEAVRLHWQRCEIQKELGNRRGLAFALGQLSQVWHIQGQTKEALNCLLKASAIYEELNSPDRQLVFEAIGDIQAEVSDTQFGAWMEELSTDAEGMNDLLEQQGEVASSSLVH